MWAHNPQVQVRLLKKKSGKEFQYMVSHPELGSDLPIGSDRESGCDKPCWILMLSLDLLTRETSSNKISNVSLHPVPIILATKIMVHLRATWMHNKSGAVELLENLLSQIFNTPKYTLVVSTS